MPPQEANMGTQLNEKRMAVRREADRATKELPAADVRHLAWFAESADGQRNEPLVLYRKNGKVLIGPAAEHKDTAIVRVTQPRDSRRIAQRPPLDQVPPEVDAIFLGDSAVEKFLFPYYEAQRLLVRGELQRLKDEYYKQSNGYVGILHIQPSRPLFLMANGGIKPFDPKTVVDE
jgi:hypothetical protein